MNRKIDYFITENQIKLLSESHAKPSIEAFLRSLGYSSKNIASIKRMPLNTLLNGEFVHMNDILTPGDTLTINITEEDSSEKIPPSDIPLDIVYEDEDIIVLNKPAGLPIHPSLNHYENSLANGLAYYFASQNKPFIFRCSNRLDKDTSGLTVVAKHLVAASILSDKVKNREFKRTYHAIVRGTLESKEGTIDAPIGRVNDSIILRQIDYENGESAITHYRVIKEASGHSLLEINLETGRTHQIRVHFKHIGHPLIGDYMYNPDMEHMTRQALHSYRLQFTHPITKEPLDFIQPEPADMAWL